MPSTASAKPADHPTDEAGGGLSDGHDRAADEVWMRIAVAEAYAGDRIPGAGEVGCVVIQDGKLLVQGHNEAEQAHDPTGHAEIVCLRRAGLLLESTHLADCTLYCTLQPCSMCAAACVWAGIRRVVFGAGRQDVHPDYFDARHLNASDVLRDAFRDDIQIEGGILRQECARLYAGPDGEAAKKDGAK